MKKLLSLNKREFGRVYDISPVALSDRKPRRHKRVYKFKPTNDKAMLKREIQKLKHEEIESLRKSVPSPRIRSPREKAHHAFINESQYSNLGPLNQFIFKLRHKFGPRVLPMPWM